MINDPLNSQLIIPAGDPEKLDDASWVVSTPRSPVPMSTAPENFINGVNVTEAFQSLKLNSSLDPDGLSYLPLKCAVRDPSVVFTV